ncbi:glycosyltransferase family 4 protein [Kushneria indalinina]|uniref:UDP-glucose:(Heptosyl)LPS alpha-1,3-glucosyltransferase n=1 Tax=Kushneria indalinina DSM 14324 TaxID=1122140 RepID=A0A3D9DZR7_9GAMM|nr:glycosyltransferase family 4 protein [Kushneria indalinina]REC96300.1 UDP-glucose:(heptosyl)LPS alpha-1,3-glucosyltransferase [Kushneria indalinina DSM 14324]
MTEHAKPLAAIAIRQVEKSTGASRNALEQTSALIALGYEVVIIAERGNSDLVARAGARLVKTRRWPFKGARRRFWFNSRVQSWTRRHSPALLVSHGDVETPDVVYLHNCVHLASQAIHGRALPEHHEVAAIHDHVLNGKRFRRVAVNSKMMGNDLTARYDIAPDKIDISYPGYDPEQFYPERARADREEARRSLGAAPGEFLIGLVTSGNFKKRNVEGFVKLAAELDELMPSRCRFLVVGKDDASPWQHMADTLGVAERFVWRSTVSDVERLYGALDIFMLPAYIEEFGRVALEAMACGTPVMLSSGVGCAELLEDRYPELVLDAMDVQGWARGAHALLEDGARRDALSRELSTLARNYSHEQQQKKLIAAFRALGTEQAGR